MRKLAKKSVVLTLIALLTLTFSIPVYAATSADSTGAATTSGSALLDDKAGLLTGNQPTEILDALKQATTEANCNIAIATTADGLQEAAIQQYSKNYFAANIENKFDTNYTILLTVDVNSRNVDVRGYNPGSKQTINENEAIKIREAITDDLSDGMTSHDFTPAFKKYAEEAKKIALSINPDGTTNKSLFPWGTRIIISLIIGVIASLIICFIIKNQLTSVTMKTNASDYVREGSLNITQQSDRYLYSNVTKTPKPQSSSSGGGGGGSRSSGSGSTGSF